MFRFLEAIILSIVVQLTNGSNSFLRQTDYPFLSSKNTDQWQSVSQNVQFLPASAIVGDKHNNLNNNFNVDNIQDILAAGKVKDSSPSSTFHYPTRKLEDDEEEAEEVYSKQSYSSQYNVQPYVDSTNIEYDGYQQAWRLLGFMIDCDIMTYNSQYYYQNNNNNKNDHHSGDNAEKTGEGCLRYVIWAAYVDLDYEGGGIGEYQFWDREKQQWDTNSCNYMGSTNNNNNGKNNNNNNNNNNKQGSSRCAKMDCHLSDTNWKLLGLFKHDSLDDWMGQLFKHEGMCIWTDEEYSFMKNARKAWPSGCSVSGTTTDSGEQIYYDVKPLAGGSITLGLYTDTRCIKEYRNKGWGDPITVDNVLGNLLAKGGSHDSHDNNNKDYSDYTFSESLAVWDSAFDIYKICQPCVAYDLNNYGYGQNDASYGSSYNTYTYGYDDYVWNYYYKNKYKQNNFDCYDDAGYTNVNQCMKFMAKTNMYTATFRDLALATAQGTLVDSPLAGFADGSMNYVSQYLSNAAHSSAVEYLFLFASLGVLFYGIHRYKKVKKEMEKPAVPLKEPLVMA